MSRATTVFGCSVLPTDQFGDRVVQRDGITLGKVCHSKGRAYQAKGSFQPSSHWTADPATTDGHFARCRSMRDAIGHLLACAGFQDPTL